MPTHVLHFALRSQYGRHDPQGQFETDLRALLSSNDVLAEEARRLREALELASDTITALIEGADQAADEWGAAPAGMKAGKLLIALSGRLPGYRPDIDAIHANRAKISAALATGGQP